MVTGIARSKSAVLRTPNRISPFTLALGSALLFAGFSFLPRVSSNPRLAASFWASTGVLLLSLFLLRRQALRAGRVLYYEFSAKKVHYIQLMMHSSIYAYWGWYWREVYHYVPLIVAQLAFAYAFDMLVCWSQREKWILGFGPFPIVLSTNLFLWFRDDWFFLQFLMIATGVLGKEFLKWKWEGRETHIFNPSAFSLFIFSVALIITKNTPVTWGEEIASTLSRPPNIYLEIFVLGLIVQALFSVTLVTLSAAGSLYILNLIYTHSTGVYNFVDSNIPVSVFIGLHLLVTDPATSPRTSTGKVIFGGAYGACVFGLYAGLSWLGAPRFYDKLLCVPLLNLCVRWLDRMGHALEARFQTLYSLWKLGPRPSNLAHMGVWVALFTVMITTSFLGKHHPGGDPAFWQRACEQGRWNGCKTWAHSLNYFCNEGSAGACLTAGQILNEGRAVPKDAASAGDSFGRACDLGLADGCAQLIDFVSGNGQNVFEQSCNRGDGASCFILGSLVNKGAGLSKDPERAVTLFRRSCAAGWFRGCGRLGESYLWGEGTSANPALAAESFEKACQGRYAPSCANVAILYRRGMGVQKDDGLARKRLRRACELGLQSACQPGESATVSTPSEVRDGSGRGT